MKFVSLNDGQVYPAASPSGDQGDMLDTGWDVLWPGPARVYLSESDLRDILVTDGVLDLPLIVEVLTLRGWTASDEFAGFVVEFDERVARLEEELAASRAECDGLLLALRRAAPDGLAPVSGDLVTVGGEPVALGVNGKVEVEV